MARRRLLVGVGFAAGSLLVGVGADECPDGVGGVSFAPTGGSSSLVVTAPVDGISGSSFSILIWVKRERVDALETLLRQGELGADGGWVMHFTSSNTVKFVVARSVRDEYVATSSEYRDKGSWVHWGFTFDKDSLATKTFRAGIVQELRVQRGEHDDSYSNFGTSSGTTSSSGPIYLGFGSDPDRNSLGYLDFFGSMDELQVYAGRALTESEVAASYCGPVVKADSLVMSLTFDIARNLGVDFSGVSGAADLINVTSTTGKVCILDGTCPSLSCQMAPSVSCTDSYNQDSTCTFTGCGTTGFGIVGSIGSQRCQWVKNITTTWAGTIANVTVDNSDTVGYSAFDGAVVGCMECPVNAFNSTTTPCRCKEGFWSQEDRLGDKSGFCTPCPYKRRCLGGSSCAANSGGYACASCQPGYYTLASSCFPCAETAGLEYVVVAVVGSALVYWTFRLADIQQRNEVLTLTFLLAQEISLTMNIDLLWPQVLKDVWAWLGSVVTLSIAFSGPECFGTDDGAGSPFVRRWWLKACAPLVLMLLHAVVFGIRSMLSKKERGEQERVSWQVSGSGYLWGKVIYLSMLNLAFDVWVCSVPGGGSESGQDRSGQLLSHKYETDQDRSRRIMYGKTDQRLNADPSITCTLDKTGIIGEENFLIIWLVFAGLTLVLFGFVALLAKLPDSKNETYCQRLWRLVRGDENKKEEGGCAIFFCPLCFGSIVGAVGLIATSVWGGLLVGSVIAFLLFGIGFPALSLYILNRGGAEGRLDEDEFQVKYGALYMAFDREHRWWFVGPITFRRLLLQMLTTFLAKSPQALAGCSIAIHSLYGLSIALRQPYSDTRANVHTNTFDDLDLLAMFHSVVQVVVLILGLAANEGNAVAVSVLVFVFAAAGMVASAAVSALSLRAQKNKKNVLVQKQTVAIQKVLAVKKVQAV